MRSVVLFAAAVCLPAAVCRGGGLIERGDFEAAEIGALTKTTAASQTHFFLPPPAYFGRVTLPDDDGALAVAIDQGGAAGTPKCLKIDSTRLSGDGGQVIAWIAVTGRPIGRGPCTLSFQARSRSGNLEITVLGLVGWFDGKPLAAGAAQKTGKDWQRVTIDIQVPSLDALTASPMVAISLPAGARDVLWLDQFDLRVRGGPGESAGDGTLGYTRLPVKQQYIGLIDALAKRVADGIQNAAQFIKRRQRPDGSWPEYREPQQLQTLSGRGDGGVTALCALALYYSGVSRNDESLTKAVAWLEKLEIPGTYGRALRVICLSTIAADTARQTIAEDVKWLERSIRKSEAYGWGYFPEVDTTRGKGWPADNSNSQLALLALRDAYLQRVECDPRLWEAVGRYWIKAQQKDGGWAYRIPPLPESSFTYTSMTAAGLASCYIVFDMVFATGPKGRCTGFGPARELLEAIEQGLAFLGEHLKNSKRMHYAEGNTPIFYYLYGVERVGRASGRRYLGDTDWYRWGAEWLLGAQQPDGRPFKAADGATVPDYVWLYRSAFSVIFLARGQGPIVINKIEIAGEHESLLRDAANVARYLTKSFERPLNWQLIGLDAPLASLLQAPVMYLNLSKVPDFTDPELATLRDYVLEGGTIFINSAVGVRLNKDVAALIGKILPEFELATLPPQHPVFEAHFKGLSRRHLMGVTNGVRTLLFYSPRDLGCSLHRYRVATREADFKLLGNVVLYAIDRRHWRTRLTPAPFDPNPPVPTMHVGIATARHGAGWQSHPAKLKQLDRYLRLHYKLGVRPTAGAELTEPITPSTTLLWLAGRGRLSLNDAQKAQLKRYVDAGGLLLVEAVGSSDRFAAAAEKQLKTIWPDLELDLVSTDSPVVTGRFTGTRGFDLSSVQCRRPLTGTSGGRTAPQLYAIEAGGETLGWFSRLDLSSGLANNTSYDLQGFGNDDAKKLLANIVLFAMSRRAR